MSGIILVGILSGMIFGALATMVRPYASAIILAPVILAPLVFLFMWRDALIGHCFFASNFNTETCTPMRALVSTTLAHAGDTVIVVVSHIVIAFIMVALLSVLRDVIARANMKSPYQKEMEQKAYEQRVEAQLRLKRKMEEDMEAATKAIHASRAARKKAEAERQQKASAEAV
ncbi:MAG: hypothetical protein JJ908_12885 [Rhizobiales bacterium]|nr:hypothetical protein [Hyphomicrobiales bacterium]MBO6699720.1 hypothetical protein [Hyphomicrobiales bacterium]MBO6737258.1 hypothetical protein [Hyphomicrobiales bacterium]MBO6911668.1 hypothetical protein [Hyphomicrobiales bacterium]MBO6954910.1 hypothetical protein [Hyphomicrobiales bacterium]